MSQQQEQPNNMMALPVQEVFFDEKSREEFLGVASKFRNTNSILKLAVNLINEHDTEQAQRILAELINWNSQQILLYKVLGLITPIGRVQTKNLHPKAVECLKQKQPIKQIPDALKNLQYVFYADDPFIPKMVKEGTNNLDLIKTEEFPPVHRDLWNFILRTGEIGQSIQEFVLPAKQEFQMPTNLFAAGPIDEADLVDVHQAIFKAGEKTFNLLKELRADPYSDRYIINTLAIRVQDRFTRAHNKLKSVIDDQPLARTHETDNQQLARAHEVDPITEEEVRHLVEQALTALNQLLTMLDADPTSQGLRDAIRDVFHTGCTAHALMEKLFYVEEIPFNIFDDLHISEEEQHVELETVSEQEEEEPKEEKPVEAKYSMKGHQIIDAEICVPKSESTSVSPAFEEEQGTEEEEEEQEDDSKYRKLPFKFIYKIDRNAYQRYSYTYNEILKKLDDIKKADPSKSAEVAILLSFIQRETTNADQLFKNITLAIKFFRDKFHIDNRKLAERLMKLLFRLKSIAIEVSN